MSRPKKKYTDRYIYAPKVYAVIHNSLDVPPEIAVKLCTELGRYATTAEEIAKEMKL